MGQRGWMRQAVAWLCALAATATLAGGAPAAAQIATANLDVSITIANACTVSGAALNFGTRGLLTASVDATAALSVTCSNGAAYSIALDDGQNASSGVRRMAAGGAFVAYNLYRDAPRSLPWASAQPSQLTGVGTGAPQTVTVYGRVPPQVTPAAGTYTDTVIVSVTY